MGKWTHLAQKKFDSSYEFDKDGENNLLATLFKLIQGSILAWMIGSKKVWSNILSCMQISGIKSC